MTPDLVAEPGPFAFDNLNGGTGPTGSWCKAGSYSDAFAETTDLPGAAWLRPATWTRTATASTRRGARSTSTWQGVREQRGYGSSGAYDMTGERIALQIPQLPVPPQGEAYSAWASTATPTCTDAHQRRLRVLLRRVRRLVSPSGKAAPALPVWIGFREADGRIHCEILEDGAWNTRSAQGTVDQRTWTCSWARTYSDSLTGPTRRSTAKQPLACSLMFAACIGRRPETGTSATSLEPERSRMRKGGQM